MNYGVRSNLHIFSLFPSQPDQHEINKVEHFKNLEWKYKLQLCFKLREGNELQTAHLCLLNINTRLLKHLTEKNSFAQFINRVFAVWVIFLFSKTDELFLHCCRITKSQWTKGDLYFCKSSKRKSCGGKVGHFFTTVSFFLLWPFIALCIAVFKVSLLS